MNARQRLTPAMQAYLRASEQQSAPRSRQQAPAPQQPRPEKQAAFKNFSASRLYCAKCKQAMPVREKLLLVLPGGELYDFLCTGCGASLGTKTT